MNRFSFREFGFVAVAIIATLAAPCLGAPVKNAASSASDLTREFAVVPSGDALYNALEAVRHAGWSSLFPENSTPESPTAAVLTRYEMAIETAKAVVTVRARANADPRWTSTLAARVPEATRGLRALCVALAPELARFDVDAPAMAAQLSSWLAVPARKDFSIAPHADAFSEKFNASTPAAPDATLLFGADVPATPVFELPLSQRLRVYAAVSSLARAQNDPFQHDLNASSTQAAAGVALSLGSRLRVRAGVSNTSDADVVDNQNDVRSPHFSQSGFSEQSLGGGVDLALRENMILSGEIARVHSQRAGTDNWLSAPIGANFDGTKIEGGLNLSGWQNRVALSAHLSRLVPEDSLALATTAAQFNLGIGLSQQISLNLLYRQLFDAPQDPRANRVLGGGININF